MCGLFIYKIIIVLMFLEENKDENTKNGLSRLTGKINKRYDCQSCKNLQGTRP